jgi:hypothetical protein
VALPKKALPQCCKRPSCGIKMLKGQCQVVYANEKADLRKQLQRTKCRQGRDGLCSTAIIAHQSRPASCPSAHLGHRFSHILTVPYTLQQHRGLERTEAAPLRPEHFLAPITKAVKQSAVRRAMAQHSTKVTMTALSRQQEALPAKLHTSDSDGRITRSPLQSLQPVQSCSSQLCSIQSSCRWCCCKAFPTAASTVCLLHHNAWIG